jgi:cytochrome b561/polyisoprenoid-binding protein YceI
MPLNNTVTRYGGVAKSFHWLTALLILTAIPLGLIAEDMPFGSAEELAAKAQLFSIHKTVGLTTFFVALLRILWALAQPKPATLHPDRRMETFAAETVHWALYFSLVLVPLSGWLHHAATEGFAPILWPFGQSLPFVPKNPELADMFGSFHWLFTKILIVAILLHVAGALKHVVIDRDATLRRMWFGTTALTEPMPARHSAAPFLAAVAIWAAAIAGGWSLASEGAGGPEAPALAAVESDWTVTQGALGFTVRQMGADVQGSFADWNAAIAFAPEAGLGHVDTQINVASLTLGSVTQQALGPEFFDTANHPTATFAADIRPEGEGFIADGTLTLHGIEAPLALPFTMEIAGDTATMQGEVVLDRRIFGIGERYTDETQVGTMVTVTVNLTATR